MATDVNLIVNHFVVFFKLQYEQRTARSLKSVKESGVFLK